MSRRTFIPIWQPHAQVPYMKGRGFRRRFREYSAFTLHKSSVRKANVPVDDKEVRWYGDNLQNSEVSQVTHGRITQRVGLFHNAKNSQVIVNDISSAVKKTSNKQIGRLVAPDQYEIYPETPCAGSSTLDIAKGESRCLQRDNGYQFADDKSMTNQRYPKIQKDFLCTSVTGSERSTYAPQPLHNDEENETSTSSGFTRTLPEHVMNRPARCTQNLSASASDNSRQYGSSFDNGDTEPIRKRFCGSVRDLAIKQQQRMCTPSLHSTTQPVSCKARIGFSLPHVAARVLSALPAIYLRDDNHDKYETIAIRLLNESIKRSELFPGSSSHVFRSFLDRTGGISDEGNPIWGNDNACENIFQQDLFDLGNASTTHPVTPEIEKLFNRTVVEKNPDENPMLSLSADSRKHGLNGESVSYLMTPSSVDSPPFHSAAPSSGNNRAFVVGPQSLFRSECEQSSSTSGSSPQSEGVIAPYFEWILPPPHGDA